MNPVTAFLLELVLPSRCVFCRRVLEKGETGLCAACQNDLPWRMEAPHAGRHFTAFVAPLWYRDNVRKSFLQYKFQDKRHFSKLYAKLMAQCVQDNFRDRYDLITWVPLSSRRRRKRGFDQTRLLAERMAVQLGTAAVPTLEKLRDTRAQSSLTDPADRRRNVKGAYRCADPEQVRGRRVLLADDIITTGATLSECAECLLKAGAAEVICVAFACAGKGGAGRNFPIEKET